MITLSRFEQQLPAKQLQKGVFYFEEELVCNLTEANPGYWKADVSGVKDYQVQLTLKQDEITETFCDCPHEVDFCKHVVAVIYAITSEMKKREQDTDRASLRNTLSMLVSNIPESALRNLVINYAIANPGFRDHLEGKEG